MSGIKKAFSDFDADILDAFGGRAAQRATESTERISGLQLQELRRQFDIGQERLEPFFQEAVPAFQLQAALSGARGPEAQEQAFQDFRDSPGQSFLREQGLRMINTGAAATGGLGGGERLRELTRFSQGLAQQDFQNQFNRLGVVSGQGQASASQQAGLGAQFAGQSAAALGNQSLAIQNILGQQQQSQREAIGVGAGLATSFFGGGGAAAASDIRLKENISKIGELDNGLNWYVWDWKEGTEHIVGDQPSEGVIAQEVMLLLHDAVIEKDDFLFVDYARIH